MPRQLIVSIKTVSALIGILVGMFGAFQSYAVLPYRMEQQEKKTEMLRIKAELDHDILVKMSSDIQYIREKIEKTR